MGIKTTVDNRGVVSEKVAGSDKLVVNVKQKKDLNVLAADASGPADGEKVLVVAASSAVVTASLPAIGDGNVGTRFHIVNTDNSNDVVLSGTNNIDASSWEEAYTTPHSIEVIAVSSSVGGFEWFTISNS
jgi:hypothetical protein